MSIFRHRRKFLQYAASLVLGKGLAKVAAGTVAGAVGGLLGTSDLACAAARENTDLAVLIDVDKCTGCGACVTACRARNFASVPVPALPVPESYPPDRRNSDWSDRREIVDRLTPYNWLYIQTCTMPGENGPVNVSLPRRCLHCINPPCANLCPSGAARQEASGAVYIDHNVCLGDGQCDRACPWIIPRRQVGVGPYLKIAPRYIGRGLMFKCDFCRELLEEGQLPVCVNACPNKAQSMGLRKDIIARAKTLVAERKGDIFGLNENGGTNTIYVSSRLFRDIEAALLRQNMVGGGGRPSLRPAGAGMEQENRLLGTVLLAAPLGAALAGIRIWRDKQKRRNNDA